MNVVATESELSVHDSRRSVYDGKTFFPNWINQQAGKITVAEAAQIDPILLEPVSMLQMWSLIYVEVKCTEMCKILIDAVYKFAV